MATSAAASGARSSSSNKDSPAPSSSKQKATQNGTPTRSKTPRDPATDTDPSNESSTPDQHAHDRLVFLAATFSGCSCQVTTKTGEKFTGIFSSLSTDSQDSRFALKMSRKLPQDPDHDLDDQYEFDGYGSDYFKNFSLIDVIDLSVSNASIDKIQAKTPNGKIDLYPILAAFFHAKIPPGHGPTFRTDADISGNLAVRQRELQPWQPDPQDNLTLSLNNGENSSGWDQFAINEKLYGVKSDYDENFYTTSIDRSHPEYRQRAAAADRKAREIEAGSMASHAHKAENEDATDEEDRSILSLSRLVFSAPNSPCRFSGVKRDVLSVPPLTQSQSNKYTPPARRAPTAHATVPGAPVDPAIIDSQLVRPDSASSKSQRSAKPNATSSASVTDKDGNSQVAPKDENLREKSRAITPSRDPSHPATPSKQLNTNPNSSKASATSRSPAPGMNATETVEYDVLKSFKDFSASEKLRLQERQRQNVKREREIKFNDLKKFATNFKLKSALPSDILGILAKDPHRQEELIKKSHKVLEDQTAPPKAPAAPSEPSHQRPPAPLRHEAGASVSGATFDAPPSRGGRGSHGPRGAHSGRNDKSFNASGHYPMVSPRGSGHAGFGQRLLAQPQYAPRPMPNVMTMHDGRVPPTGPSAITTDLPITRSGPLSGNSTRFNVQAMEFRPNPAANTFSPTTQQSGGSSPRKSSQESRTPFKGSFFGNEQQPRSRTEHGQVEDEQNTVKRLKKLAEREGRKKEFLSNLGIPQAYRTPPTWEVPEGNRDKTYADMFEKPAPPVQSISPANVPLPHQHQLPMHLQPGPSSGPQPQSMQVPHQGPRPQYGSGHHSQRNDHQYDDHRMHLSSSSSSMYNSPRFHAQNMVVQPPQMLNQAQPMYGQGMTQYVMPPGSATPQGMQYVRPMPGNQQYLPMQGGHMAGPVMMQASNSAMGMNMQPQQMHMYPTTQGHMMPGHAGGPQNSSGFPSPQTAPMMVQRGSNQGQQGQYVFVTQNQPGQAIFSPQQIPQHQPHSEQNLPCLEWQPILTENPVVMQMRGGVPMQQQHSYGASPHMHQQYPVQHRAPHYGGQFPPQQMPSQHPVNGPMQAPMTMMNHMGDREEVK